MNSKSNTLSACTNRFVLALVFAVFFFSPSFAYNVTVGWDSNDEPDLKGYTVYHNIGSPGPPYKYSDDVSEKDLANPLYPKVILTGIKGDTKYYVAVTAYDDEGNESRYSDDVCVQIIDSAINVCSSSSSTSGSSGGGGGGGGACFIATTCAPASNSLPLILPYIITSTALLFLLLFQAAKSIRSRTSTI